MFGGFFVRGGIWQFDYPNKRNGKIVSINWDKINTNQISMKVQKNPQGKITGIHSALDIIIENETLQLLLDTGVTFLPTKKVENISNLKV